MISAAEPGWRVLKSETLCATPHRHVDREQEATAARPGGVDWLVVHRRTAVVVAPRAAGGGLA